MSRALDSLDTGVQLRTGLAVAHGQGIANGGKQNRKQRQHAKDLSREAYPKDL